MKSNQICNCKHTQKVESLWLDKTVDAETSEPQTIGEPVADICESCQRPIIKTQIIVELIDEQK